MLIYRARVAQGIDRSCAESPVLTQLFLCRRESNPQQPPRAKFLDGRPHEAHLLRGIPAVLFIAHTHGLW